MSLERLTSRLKLDELDRVNFDKALMPEDKWEGDLAEDEFEVKRIEDVR